MASFEKVFIRGAAGFSNEGILKVDAQGFDWNGGTRNVKIAKGELTSLTWTPLHFGFQLGATTTDGTVFNFTGLRHEAYEKLVNFNLGDIKKEELCTKGINWGKLEVVGKEAVLYGEPGKPIFKIPLPDVSSVQYGKDEMSFDFGAVDIKEGEDAVVGMSFHIPTECKDFPMAGERRDEEAPELGDPETEVKKTLPAKRFYELVMPHIDAAGKFETPIGTFDDVTVLVPRGRFEVQLHDSYLKMVGQAQDFKIKYKSIHSISEFQSMCLCSSILHLFILPKPNPAVTVVVVTLDPPIRKGQTFYNHVLFQFETEAEMTLELNLHQNELNEKNKTHGGNLKKAMSSMAFDVFAACLRGLSGARLTRPRTFANFANDGSCVRCFYKNDEGYLFPLERAFFYIHKPPLCITHDEVGSIEFQRQGTNVVSATVRTFDLCIRTKQGAEHQFRGIQRNEWQLLCDFFEKKNLIVENVDSVRQGPAQHVSSVPLEDVDLDIRRPSGDSSDDSDPDFMQPEQEDEDVASDSDSSSGVEMVDEAEISDPEPREGSDEEPAGEGSAMKTAAGLLPSKSPKKRAKERKTDDGEKKKRKKKDKNAPKKNLSAYMFFSQEHRDIVRQENPGIAFGEVGKALGEKWKTLTAEEKVKYEDMAKQDKMRYQEQMSNYVAQASSQQPPSNP